MAEYNVKINVKTDTGYDQLYPKSKSDIIDFDKTNSNLSSTDVESAIKEVNTKANTNKTNIGTLASLTTDSKTNLVGAINEVDSHANTNKTNIGTLSSLKTSVKNSIVNAINWLYDNVVHKTSVIDNLDDIVANQANGMVAGAKAIAELNSKTEPIAIKSDELLTAENGSDVQWCDAYVIGKMVILSCTIGIPRFPNNWEQLIVAHINDPFGIPLGAPDVQPIAICANQKGECAHFFIDSEGNIKIDGQVYSNNTGNLFYRGFFVYAIE